MHAPADCKPRRQLERQVAEATAHCGRLLQCEIAWASQRCAGTLARNWHRELAPGSNQAQAGAAQRGLASSAAWVRAWLIAHPGGLAWCSA